MAKFLSTSGFWGLRPQTLTGALPLDPAGGPPDALVVPPLANSWLRPCSNVLRKKQLNARNNFNSICSRFQHGMQPYKRKTLFRQSFISLCRVTIGLSNSDGKLGQAFSYNIPWQASHSHGIWDVTVGCPVAAAARVAVSELAAARKSANLDTRYTFQPIAKETSGPINDSAPDFLLNLG